MDESEELDYIGDICKKYDGTSKQIVKKMRIASMLESMGIININNSIRNKNCASENIDNIINFVSKDKLDMMSADKKHQGVMAICSAYEYADIEDIFAKAEEKGEAPFIFILDEIEDPHNLGAIIRTANLCGAHGVIIPKRRAAGLTSTVVKASAGAINYTPVAKVTNITKTIEELKERGLWFVCADMGGETMYRLNLKGPIGLVIGNEGEGVSRLVKEKCDFVTGIPMKGDIDSLNASVAAGVLMYEIVRQRFGK